MSLHQPLLETPRLLLRPLELSDSTKIQHLAGDFSIANKTLSVPHPYHDGMAGQWIGVHLAGWQAKTSIMFAIVEKQLNKLIGCVGLEHIKDNHAQIGFWIGVPYWGNGFCTEAALAVKEYASRDLELHYLYARHLHREPSSGKVMKKIGMEYKNSVERLHNNHKEQLDYYECVLAKSHIETK
ncbi:TPA: GNAT family N-acetyltransferase [Photobacterium damselae]